MALVLFGAIECPPHFNARQMTTTNLYGDFNARKKRLECILKVAVDMHLLWDSTAPGNDKHDIWRVKVHLKYIQAYFYVRWSLPHINACLSFPERWSLPCKCMAGSIDVTFRYFFTFIFREYALEGFGRLDFLPLSSTFRCKSILENVPLIFIGFLCFARVQGSPFHFWDWRLRTRTLGVICATPITLRSVVAYPDTPYFSAAVTTTQKRCHLATKGSFRSRLGSLSLHDEW